MVNHSRSRHRRSEPQTQPHEALDDDTLEDGYNGVETYCRPFAAPSQRAATTVKRGLAALIPTRQTWRVFSGLNLPAILP